MSSVGRTGLMAKVPVKIRRAKPEDLHAIYDMGRDEEGFAVSSFTKFYGENYLRNWIKEPRDDILLVADSDGEISGFVLCRVIRGSTAILDNIGVKYSKRNRGIGGLLLEECMRLLKRAGIGYVAAIVRSGHRSLGFFKSHGFRTGNEFTWIERDLREG